MWILTARQFTLVTAFFLCSGRLLQELTSLSLPVGEGVLQSQVGFVEELGFAQNESTVEDTESWDKNTRYKNPYSSYKGKKSDFSYVYLVGGVKPESPSYRSYIYDICISTFLQREENSTADVIVIFQMSFKSSHDALPQSDIDLLESMNIKFQYIPKSADESFYRIMLDKFRVLKLKEYKRVIFMDADVLAMGNLDYLFKLSVDGVLEENVVFSGTTEPANGGFFMLNPKEDSFQRVVKIIKDGKDRGRQLPYPYWDEELGWGKRLENPYKLLGGAPDKESQLWKFYGAFADQGLLYSWTMYEEQSVSIFFRQHIENWNCGNMTKLMIADVVEGRKEHLCFKGFMKGKPCISPHSDFIHYTGRSKPWMSGPPEDMASAPKETSAKHYWFHVLQQLNSIMDLEIDFDNWSGERPTLGLFPQRRDVGKANFTGMPRHLLELIDFY